jgi:type II restriction enzyme
MTIQQGISKKQLNDMKEDGVQLIVPQEFHKQYPPNSDMKLLQVGEFVDLVRKRLG